jgi:hypothetical protein
MEEPPVVLRLLSLVGVKTLLLGQVVVRSFFASFSEFVLSLACKDVT